MNEFEKFLQSDTFKQAIDERVGTLAKADTVDQNTGLVWYDLSRIVQEMHPFKQLIPLISSLPRVPADGGTAHRWLGHPGRGHQLNTRSIFVADFLCGWHFILGKSRRRALRVSTAIILPSLAFSVDYRVSACRG